MLKIKDEVDLKELEKFGFRYIKNSNYPNLSNQEYYYDYLGTISIYENTRATIVRYTGEETIDTLYDLIQAGLVEKNIILSKNTKELSLKDKIIIKLFPKTFIKVYDIGAKNYFSYIKF